MSYQRARYAPLATPEMVHDGDMVTDKAILALDQDALFELTELDLGLIEPEAMGDADYRLSGAGWDGHGGDSYRRMEAAIASGADIPPLVTVRRPDGTYSMLDGYHRASLARNLGIQRLAVYVHDPARQAELAASPAGQELLTSARPRIGKLATLAEARQASALLDGPAPSW